MNERAENGANNSEDRIVFPQGEDRRKSISEIRKLNHARFQTETLTQWTVFVLSPHKNKCFPP